MLARGPSAGIIGPMGFYGRHVFLYKGLASPGE